MTVLRASSISYGVDGVMLLSDLDLAVGAGQVVAVAGPNGAGKTTALELLSGELSPSSGTVTIGGRDLAATALAERALLRSVLPARPEPDVPFAVREVVQLGRRPHGDLRDGGLAIVDQALRRTDTTPLADRTFRDLSTGEQARVALARVLAQSAPVVLLDEPTASLDMRHASLIMTTVREVAAEGAAVIAVLHDLNLAAVHADHVVLLHEGVVAAAGAPLEVLTGSLLSDVYDHAVTVIPHPTGRGPLLVIS